MWLGVGGGPGVRDFFTINPNSNYFFRGEGVAGGGGGGARVSEFFLNTES